MGRDKRGELEAFLKVQKLAIRALLNLKRRNIQNRKLRLNAHGIPKEIKKARKEKIAIRSWKFWNL